MSGTIMPRLVAFLRAINVGGHVVKMDELRRLFTVAGMQDVETFIASGNVVFTSSARNIRALQPRIEERLRESLGYEVATMVRTGPEVAAVAAHVPFKESDVKAAIRSNIGFLSEPLGAPGRAALAALCTENDDYQLRGTEIYWLSRTRMSEAISSVKLEKLIGTRVTFRGVNTVARLVAKYGFTLGVALLLFSFSAFMAGCAPVRRAPEAAGRSGASVVERGRLPTTWYAGGARCTGRPAFRVHQYNDDFYILRQPACTNYEKPFLYLLFGTQRALLLDTGAGGIDVAGAVDSIVRAWSARHGVAPVALVVAHSHAHGDHVAGDSQFVGKAAVTLVGRDTASVRKFFGIGRWPDDVAEFDLGGRILDVIPIPGHQPASVALYDRRTAVLLSGDTFYPGRLYVRDTAAFVRSIARLVAFTSTRPVAHILGTHIENSRTPYVDYVVGTVDQPDEHVLQLSRSGLLSLDSALATMRGHVVRTVMPKFSIWPQP